jgi:hypothetical protein
MLLSALFHVVSQATTLRVHCAPAGQHRTGSKSSRQPPLPSPLPPVGFAVYATKTLSSWGVEFYDILAAYYSTQLHFTTVVSTQSLVVEIRVNYIFLGAIEGFLLFFVYLFIYFSCCISSFTSFSYAF